jgi:large repetitive protein
VTVAATDGTYTDSATFMWVVNPVVVVTPPAKQANHEGNTISGVTVTATDTNSSPLTFSASNLPSGLTIDPTTGVISGTVATGAAGSSPYTVTVTATDGTFSGSATFTWLVDNSTNPVVTAPATQESVEGAAVSGVTVTATEGNSNPLTFSATNLPSGLTINPTTGVISGTIAAGNSTTSPQTVTVSATDGLNTGTATFTWVITPTTPSPALPFSLTNPAWQTLPSGVRTWDVTTGTGATAASGDGITVSYTLYLTTSGTPIQTNPSFSTTLVTGDLIPGWLDGIPGMKVGGERRLDIPSALGYSTGGSGSIPPNAELVFDITLISVS